MTNAQRRETPIDVLKELRSLAGGPSIDKIARHSGSEDPSEKISRSTVSRVLNEAPGVRKESVRAFIVGCIGHAHRSKKWSQRNGSVQNWYERYSAARGPDPAEASAWVRLVERHEAWPPDNPAGVEVRNHAVAIARRLHQMYREAEPALTTGDRDPWHDPELAERMSGWMTRLISWLGPGVEFSAAEAALLALAPLAHQTDITWSATRLAVVRPTDLDRAEDPDDNRGRYQKFLMTEPHRRLASRAGADRLPDREQAPREIGWWLFHRWVDSELRTEAGHSLDALLDDQVVADDTPNKLVRALRNLLRGLRRNPDELPTQWSPDHATFDHPQMIRKQLVGLLIVLAHALAIEVSTLSSIIVQHLGIPDPVDLEKLWDTVRKAEWDHSRVSLGLRAFCHHEAVLAALTEHAAYVDTVLRAVHGTANPIETLRPLRALPPRVSADRVLPAEDSRGKAVFATPVSGFRLDEERIRELLMDRHLYRDSALAIRELYQNALDACRYRWARIQHRNKLDNTSAAWGGGEISFEQGIDDVKGHYLECRDTGVGMAKADLQGAFSRAGVRFTDSSEFLEEREEWRVSGVKFHPNSRFGIGVMSYFMLADEIEVETCRMSRDGRPGTAHKVSIVGPGHLFRIQPGTRNEPGTRVRLYLREKDQAPSCVDVLRRLLGIAEFRTVAIHGDRMERWEPDTLKPRRRSAHEPDGIDAFGERTVGLKRDDGQVFWCEYGGALLVDGIHLGTAKRHGVFADPSQDGDLRGAVVNLIRGEPPTLSVDRMLVLDDVSERVEALLTDAVDALIQQRPRFLCVGWLDDVAQSSPWVADLVTRKAVEADIELPIDGDRSFDTKVTGCFPPDPDLLSLDRNRSRGWDAKQRHVHSMVRTLYYPNLDIDRVPDHIALWRLIAHRDKSVAQLAEIVPDLADRTAVHPAVPSDAALLANEESWSLEDRNGRDAAPPPGHLLWIAANAGISPHSAAQRAALLGFDDVEPHRFPLKREPSSTNLALLSEDLNGEAPWLTTDEPVHFGHLMDARRILRLSVAEAADRLTRFGLHVPHAGHFVGHLIPADIKLLSHHLDGEFPWLDYDKPVADMHVLRASSELGFDMADIVERLNRFGFTPPDLKDLPELPTARDLQLLSVRLDGNGRWLDRDLPVPPQHVIRAAQELGCSPRDVAEQLDALGLIVRNLRQVPDELADDIDSEILGYNSTDGAKSDLDPDLPIQPIQLFWIVTQLRDRSQHEVAERLTSYGFRVSADTVDLSEQLTPPDLRLLSRDYNGRPAWLNIKEIVPMAHLTRAFLEADHSPRAVAERLTSLGFTIEDHHGNLPDSLSRRDLRLLSADNQTGGWIDVKKPVPLLQLVRSAHATDMPIPEVAQRLRDLGLQVPDLADTIRTALNRIPWQ